jgi:DNA-binding NtrC family response regulator
MKPMTILVVDDDDQLRKTLHLGLKAAGYEVLEASSGKSGLSRCSQDVDLVLLDFQLPDTTGIELLGPLKEKAQDAVVIMMTAHATVDRAVEAMKLGAFHYAQKPVDMEQLLVLMEKGLETTRLRRELRSLRDDRSRPYAIDTIIGESPAIVEFKNLIEKTARSPASTVLLLGESGTGKGLAAKIIHHGSARRDRPFMNITCSALPATLLESELFGHERGAFTDAKQQKKGLLELAEGGTVFLDEFTEMAPMLQAKLLRFLEEKAFKRLGGAKDLSVDVRVIAATNRGMDEAVAAGALRKDLYYRLQVLTIEIPSLRDRQGDAPLLARYFIDHFNKEFGKEVKGLSSEAIRLLEAHPWEGNVRELRNAIERAMLFAEGEQLVPSDLSTIAEKAAVAETYLLPPGGVDLDELEKSMVVQALERAKGNRTRAGELLGISRDQVRYRIEKFHLE